MIQVVQISGAIAILLGFGLAQTGKVNVRNLAYLLLNLFGAIALGVTALLEQQWGFVMLETAWVLVTLLGLYQRAYQAVRR